MNWATRHDAFQGGSLFAGQISDQRDGLDDPMTFAP